MPDQYTTECVTMLLRRTEDGGYTLRLYAEDSSFGAGATIMRDYRAGMGVALVGDDAVRLVRAWCIAGMIGLEAENSDLQLSDRS